MESLGKANIKNLALNLPICYNALSETQTIATFSEEDAKLHYFISYYFTNVKEVIYISAAREYYTEEYVGQWSRDFRAYCNAIWKKRRQGDYDEELIDKLRLRYLVIPESVRWFVFYQ